MNSFLLVRFHYFFNLCVRFRENYRFKSANELKVILKPVIFLQSTYLIWNLDPEDTDFICLFSGILLIKVAQFYVSLIDHLFQTRFKFQPVQKQVVLRYTKCTLLSQFIYQDSKLLANLYYILVHTNHSWLVSGMGMLLCTNC